MARGPRSDKEKTEAQSSRRIGEIRENANTAREFGYNNIGKKLDDIADTKQHEHNEKKKS